MYMKKKHIYIDIYIYMYHIYMYTHIHTYMNVINLVKEKVVANNLRVI